MNEFNVWAEWLLLPQQGFEAVDLPGHAPASLTLGLDADPDSPRSLFLQLGAEQQVGEEEDVTEFPGALDQLHHEAIPQQLTVLPTGNEKSRHYTHSVRLSFVSNTPPANLTETVSEN